jgi:hypothetical protein
MNLFVNDDYDDDVAVAAVTTWLEALDQNLL